MAKLRLENLQAPRSFSSHTHAWHTAVLRFLKHATFALPLLGADALYVLLATVGASFWSRACRVEGAGAESLDPVETSLRSRAE